ncbi:MAG: GldG family protein [bacterium]
MLNKRKIQISLLLVFCIIVLINILVNYFSFRLDFTEDQRYSLSNATKNILKNLKEPVTITAYFSENLPPNVEQVRNEFKDMLIEYSEISKGNVVYEFINPNVNEQSENTAQQNGISPVMINVRERDQMKQQRAYLGAVIQCGSNKDVIPVIQPGTSMEYALSTSIKKITVTDKPTIAFLQGNGEASLSAMQEVYQTLSITYGVTNVTIDSANGIPAEYKTVAIVAPADTVKPYVFSYLDQFLSSGGRLLLAINEVNGNLNAGNGIVINTGFSEWLKSKGVEILPEFIIDISCGNILMQQQQGSFTMRTPVKFPYLPVIAKFADHPIVKGLEAVLLPFASPLKINTKQQNIKITPIAFTSQKSGVQKPPVAYDINKEWTTADFLSSNLPVAAVLEGKLTGDTNSKIVVFGDGDFAVNGEGQQAQQLQPDNLNLFVNAVDWLSDDAGLIELRTKGVTARPIDQTLEDSTKTLLKYINFLFPIAIIMVYGFVRFQSKRKIRNQLMNINIG